MIRHFARPADMGGLYMGAYDQPEAVPGEAEGELAARVGVELDATFGPNRVEVPSAPSEPGMVWDGASWADGPPPPPLVVITPPTASAKGN